MLVGLRCVQLQMDKSTDNRVLLHILKHNPKDGEVYITWEGETFRGHMQDIEVHVGVNSYTEFTVKGFLSK